VGSVDIQEIQDIAVRLELVVIVVKMVKQYFQDIVEQVVILVYLDIQVYRDLVE